jgi:hypothetical protein
VSERSDALRALFARHITYKVLNWTGSSDDPDNKIDRVVKPVNESDVVSSEREDGLHTVVLDIDHEAWLVMSTTPGHYHLYINVPDGIGWDLYEPMLRAMGDAGVLQAGYVGASVERGFSCVRLPWVKKQAGQ